jgi:hypothetical protein
VGGGGAIARTTNGVSWRSVESGTSEELFAVSPFPSGLMAVSGAGVTVVSKDGVHWSVLT